MTTGAELYVPMAAGPYISKRDSPVNNSFQRELFECMHTHMQDAHTQKWLPSKAEHTLSHAQRAAL